MSRLKKDEFYVVAVNQAAGVYKAEKWCYNDLWSNSNPNGFRYSAVYPNCMVYEFNEKGQTLADVRTFCKELDKQGFRGQIITD